MLRSGYGVCSNWNTFVATAQTANKLLLGLCMHMMPRAVPVRIAHADRPCGAEMSEISQSSRTTTVESSMKSEHNLYLACEDSPQRAFFF